MTWLDSPYSRNVQRLSPSIQNELPYYLVEETVGEIVSQCQGRRFSVLCDEVSDRSNHELLSLVIRFVKDTGDICECLVLLLEVNSITASDLHDVIINKLDTLCLSTDYLVRQWFDGTRNMSGVQASAGSHQIGVPQ
jgi:hypothetical protein